MTTPTENDLLARAEEAEQRLAEIKAALERLLSWGIYTPAWAADREKEQYEADWLAARRQLNK